MDDCSELQIGQRLVLNLGAEVRHGVIESFDEDGAHVVLELTDSIEAGRKVRAPCAQLTIAGSSTSSGSAPMQEPEPRRAEA